MGSMPAPLNTAFVVTNNASTTKQMVRGQEIVGDFIMSQVAFEDGKFPVVEFDLDPLAYPGTRLHNLSTCFQKYRFTNKTHLIVQVQAPSTTIGGYVCGYTENPDQWMGEGTIALQQISALAGATSSPAWVAQKIPVRISDTNKWYNVDGDTQEIMMAIQGKFVLQQTSLVSTTGPLVANVWIHWEIELTGNAAQVQNDSSPPLYFIPPGTFVAPTGASDTSFRGFGLTYNVNAGSGTNTIPTNTLVRITPGIETAEGESANFLWTYTYGASLGGYLLAGTEDDAFNGIYLSNQDATGSDNKLSYSGGAAEFIWGGAPVNITRVASAETIRPVRLVSNRTLREKKQALNVQSQERRLGSVIRSLKEVLKFN